MGFFWCYLGWLIIDVNIVVVILEFRLILDDIIWDIFCFTWIFFFLIFSGSTSKISILYKYPPSNVKNKLKKKKDPVANVAGWVSLMLKLPKVGFLVFIL